jgi:gliding motility-associated lipoprotein GldD
MRYLPAACLITYLMAACNSSYTPRPRGYFKIDLPAKQYRIFDQPGYPYTFEYPTYATVLRDTSYFEENPENPWWINIDFPQFNGRIYISYNHIGGRALYKVKGANGQYRDSVGTNNFGTLLNNSYKLTYKHTLKASSIDDSLMRAPTGVSGVFFKVGGNAATANQFCLTDTVHHFLRGALYFDATPNEDSLKPVNDFLLEDMQHMINTFRWKGR